MRIDDVTEGLGFVFLFTKALDALAASWIDSFDDMSNWIAPTFSGFTLTDLSSERV